jgi:hypothetical protein
VITSCFFLNQSCDIKILVSFFLAKLIEFTVGYANQNFPNFFCPKNDKSCFGAGENHHSLCNLSEKLFQGIINCKPEAEILVQSFQLVHPISLVLNPS